MDTLQQLGKELLEEFETTKKFLAHYPDDHNNYAPHEKSMKLMPLATHIVEVFAWPDMILKTEVLDFGKGDYQPTILHDKAALMQTLEGAYAAGSAALKDAEEGQLKDSWRLAHNDHTLAQWSKYEAIRHALNQVTHHRAQLGVYYRLLGIEVPSSYGPSADDQSF